MVNNRPNTIAENKSLSILFINESLLIAKWKRRFLRSRGADAGQRKINELEVYRAF